MVDRQVHHRSDSWRGSNGGRVREDLGLVDIPRIRTLSFKTRLGIWAAAMLTVAPVVASIISSPEPFVFVSGEVIPESGVAGARVETFYVGEYRRDDTCRMTLQRTWTDSRGIVWTLAPIDLNYGRGFSTIKLTLNIPMDASPGQLTLDGTLQSVCNGWQMLFPRSTTLPTLQLAVTR